MWIFSSKFIDDDVQSLVDKYKEAAIHREDCADSDQVGGAVGSASV